MYIDTKGSRLFKEPSITHTVITVFAPLTNLLIPYISEAQEASFSFKPTPAYNSVMLVFYLEMQEKSTNLES
jgi:hypothetical protein